MLHIIPHLICCQPPVLSQPRPVSRVRFIGRHWPWLPGAAWPGRHEETRNPETGTIRGEYYGHQHQHSVSHDMDHVSRFYKDSIEFVYFAKTLFSPGAGPGQEAGDL